MTPAPAESRPGPGIRWRALIALIFVAQVGMIFFLSARPAAKPRAPVAGPEVYVLRDDVAEPPGAINPTLLALPSTNGFSGQVWLRIPTLKYQLEEWHEPPRFLALQPDELGDDLRKVVLAGRQKPVELPARREPRPDYYLPEFVPAESTITLTGDLTNRILLSTFTTNSWPSTNLLSNSVVQITVNVRGDVVSPPGLLSGSGSPAADADALNQAAAVRFKALRHADSLPPSLSWGNLVFHWQTVPVPATNAPAGGGQ